MLQMLFIVTQSALLILLAIHDWVDLTPFNDVGIIRKSNGLTGMVISTAINCGIIAFSLGGTFYYRTDATPTWFSLYLVFSYMLFCFGAFMFWYRPMLFGAQVWDKEHFKKEYAHTHHLIPGGDEDVRPNTMHLFIHFFILTSAVLAILRVTGRF